MNKSANPRIRLGFTLIELLIVIAIIAILVSLSFAAYGKVTATARSAKSVSNLKQLGSTWTMITTEGVDGVSVPSPKAYFPPSGGWVNQPNWARFSWVDLLGEYLGYCERDTGNFTWNVDIAETIFRNPTVTTVPTYDGTTASDNGSLNFGYGLNSQLTNWQRNPKTRMTQVKSPSYKILIGETNPDSGTQSKDYHIVSPWAGYAAISDANRGGANCAFIDGHVEHVRHADVYAGYNWNKNPYITPTVEYTLP